MDKDINPRFSVKYPMSNLAHGHTRKMPAPALKRPGITKDSDLDRIYEQINTFSIQADRIETLSNDHRDRINAIERRQKLLMILQLLASAAFVGIVFANILFGSLSGLKDVDVAAWGAIASSLAALTFTLWKKRV